MADSPMLRSLLLRHWSSVAGADLLLPRVEVAAPPSPTALASGEPAAPEQPAAPVAPRQPSAPEENDPLADLPEEPLPRLRALEQRCQDCRRCALHERRRQAVFADGNPEAEIFFVGEGPGAQEDQQGLPFVGPAGQLLTRIIHGAMGLPRREVYIANVVKCRPPNNRNPLPEEQIRCAPFLEEQIRLVRPKILICLGAVAAQYLLGSRQGVGRLRGTVHEWHGIPLLATWHPAYLLRQPSAKRETWDDIKLALRHLGRPEQPTPYRGED
jgi:uracil-DNA glycosylase family 4